MGRRNLIVATAVATALVAVSAAGAATITWRTVGDGAAAGPTVSEAQGYIALSRRSALAQFASRLTPAARAKLAKVDFAHNALVAVFGEYGCNDGNVVTTAIVRHGATLTVKLVPRPPDPGTVSCQALFPTYRFLAVPRTALASPLPTRVTVDFA
jgi:hypothetical protein